MGGCSNKGSDHSEEAKAQPGQELPPAAFGKVRTSLPAGEVGRTEAAASERPVMVRKRKLFIRSGNSDIQVLGESVPSPFAEGLTLWVQISFWFLEVEPAERGGWKAGWHLSH